MHKVGAAWNGICIKLVQHGTGSLDRVLHGDGFIVAGCGDYLDWLSEQVKENLELVQKARLGLGHDREATVLSHCVMYSDTGPRRTGA